MNMKDVLSDCPSHVFASTNLLRKMILEIHPDIEEDFYGGKVVKMASYSIARNDNVIAVLSPATNHLKLYLHHVDKVDTGDLKLVGKGKHAKHIKIYTADEIDGDLLRNVLNRITEIVLAKV